MRYCKRITDLGIETIAIKMKELYSLDLSFCTRFTPSSICHLLKAQNESLAELRLKNCSQFQIRSGNSNSNTSDANAGPLILNAIRSSPDCALSVLDLRNCVKHSTVSRNDPYSESGPFVVGLRELGFVQSLPGFFSRAAQWNPQIQSRLVKQVMAD